MAEKNLLNFTRPKSHIAEAIRVLRTNIDFCSADRPVRTLLITSPGPGEGKSTISANLALAISKTGKKVVLIDADLRRPSQHSIFNVSNELGLTNLLVRGTDPNHVIHETDGIRLITSGPLPPNPSELLNSQKTATLLNQLMQNADIILVDSPPVVSVTDAAVLAGKTDGTILVIASGSTQIDHAREAKEQLLKVRANIIGVVLNKIDTKGSRYYYRHYYGYSSKQTEKKG